MITEIENEIIQEFELFDNWEDKYQYIIDLGKELKGMDEQLKTFFAVTINLDSNFW